MNENEMFSFFHVTHMFSYKWYGMDTKLIENNIWRVCVYSLIYRKLKKRLWEFFFENCYIFQWVFLLGNIFTGGSLSFLLVTHDKCRLNFIISSILEIGNVILKN